MNALILTLFVSLVLVAGAAALLVKVIRGGDVEHGDRLSLLPLEEEHPIPADGTVSPTPKPPATARRMNPHDR